MLMIPWTDMQEVNQPIFFYRKDGRGVHAKVGFIRILQKKIGFIATAVK
jgi:hypothetical protein